MRFFLSLFLIILIFVLIGFKGDVADDQVPVIVTGTVFAKNSSTKKVVAIKEAHVNLQLNGIENDYLNGITDMDGHFYIHIDQKDKDYEVVYAAIGANINQESIYKDPTLMTFTARKILKSGKAFTSKPINKIHFIQNSCSGNYELEVGSLLVEAAN